MISLRLLMKRCSPVKNVLPPLILTFLAVFLSCQADSEQSSAENSAVTAESVYFEDYDSPANKWGFFDTTGTVTISARYDLVSGFTEGVAAVNFKGRWGYIDHIGGRVIGYHYLAAWPFCNGFARVTKFDGTQCLIDKQGVERCIENATSLNDVYSNRARVEFPSAQGFVNSAGTLVIPAQYEQASNFSDGFAVVTFDGSQGLIDTSGNFVIEARYDKVVWPSEALVPVRRSNVWTYIDLNGASSIDGEFERAGAFVNGFATVKKNGGWYLLNPVRGNCQQLAV